MLLQFEDFEIDPTCFELRRGGRPVAVPRLVFDLILYLAEHRDRPVTKAELLERVWPGRTVTEASLTQAMTSARRTLADTPDTQRIIRTLPGRGYWWVAETRVQDGTTPRRSTDGFVGRSAEVVLATEGLNTALAGGLFVLRVIGEPGIGKSRFAEELARLAEGFNFCVLFGRCAESSGEASRSPWHEVLRDAKQALRTTGYSSSPRSDTRLDLLDEIPAYIRRCLDARPTLVVLDDVHRLDWLSSRVLLSLARDNGSRSLMIAVTQRHQPRSSRGAIGDELMRFGQTRSVTLGPLSLSEVGALIDQSTAESATIDPALLLERSGGNPFFATELIRGWGCSLGPDGRPGGLPSTVSDAIERQIKSLPPQVGQILSAAAVVGREFDASMLAHSKGVAVGDLLDVLDELQVLGLLEQRKDHPEIFRFRHVLVREAVYRHVPCGERSRLHLAAARAITETSGCDEGMHLLALAHHLRAALPLGSADEVLRVSLQAARFAIRVLEPEGAIECCRETLHVLERCRANARTRLELLVALALAELRAGYRKEAKATLTTVQAGAQAAGENDLVGAAALALAPGFLSIETGVVDWELISTLEHALAVLSTEPSVMRVQLLSRLAQALYWSEGRERIVGLVREATVLADHLRSDVARGWATLARYGALWGPESLRERGDLASAILDLTRAPKDTEVEMMGRVFRMTTMLERGERARAESEVTALHRLSTHEDCVHGRWYPPMYQAMTAIGDGRFEDAKALIESYHALGQRLDDANVTQTCLLQTTEVLWQSGCAEAVVETVEANIEINPALHEWQAALVFLKARAGRFEEARVGLRALAGRPLAGISHRMNAVIAVAALGEAAWMLRDTVAAGRLSPVVARWEERIIVAGYGVLLWGSTARTRGHLCAVLGNFEEAEDWYRRALRLEGSAGSLVWRARTQLAYARLLRKWSRPGDCERAAKLAAVASRFAESRGLDALASEASEESANQVVREGGSG